MKSLSVLPAYRRRGVGAALLRRAFARYAEKGRRSVGLGVDLTNPTAPLSLYRSVGLRETQWTDMYELAVPAGRCVIDDPGPARPAVRLDGGSRLGGCDTRCYADAVPVGRDRSSVT